jgi:hypothetical protein
MIEANCVKIAETNAVAMTQIPNDVTANNGKIVCVERGSEETTYVKLAENLNVDGTCKTGKFKIPPLNLTKFRIHSLWW